VGNATHTASTKGRKPSAKRNRKNRCRLRRD